ncbi:MULTISPECIES: ABC transporter ATP-binding protein [Streptomyces]|jgi:iron complex transport system ATP-binding protein|uniref:ABC transporter ATP-binding protein n=1 Tax=Streptomyces TaxID=1883 RepID=UPI0013ABF593|nr:MULTISPECIES: ABC transporter ATP-binding protein [Streptomyces]MYS47211.1 ATP-binding cassette domain-containing protein [Streptomyces sp. SID5998]NED77087.1 ABC transporter ATP-binding protein [Streptomyces sp. SID9944]MBY8868779.1 ABC transporter ATP-binding protein [Streptomyces sennicomposti]NED36828.1 ABC transporter ATP-binding protein [Streptomyces sp. SID8499]NMO34790.1 ABC transporter ATP-binding protein [Streptomyces sp. GMY02]
MSARLSARDITLRYGDRVVATRLSLDIPDGAFTAVVGPNACGKSTLLRSLVRLLRPAEGRVELDGREVGSYPSKELARQVGFLPQDPLAPEDVKVRQLVARGRYPHQSLLKLWSERDEDAVTGAMAAAGVTELADRPVQELSGGQRQRVWIAMALAQETPYLLLDEPTSFLDITHQYQLLCLLAELRDQGRTVIAVLHDINQACRFADHLVAMRDGRVVAEGRPADIVDAALIKDVFDLPSVIVPDPVTATPMVVPTLQGE